MCELVTKLDGVNTERRLYTYPCGCYLMTLKEKGKETPIVGDLCIYHLCTILRIKDWDNEEPVEELAMELKKRHILR